MRKVDFMDRSKIAVQLYTVRDFVGTLNEVSSTFNRLAAIGYSGVELFFPKPFAPKDVRKALDDSSLKAVGSFVGWERLEAELDAVIAEHHILNCYHITMLGFPPGCLDLDGLKKFLALLRPVSERLAEEGIKLAYHNHSFEFAHVEGRTLLDWLYEETSPDHLKAELDVYWIQHGGADPVAWIQKCAGRISLLHMKDMALTLEGEQRFSEVGTGNLNWPAIVEAAKSAGVKWYVAEQDLCYDRDPFESLSISYKNMLKM
jgi:sugar phosphate isomerase/epimerase